MESLNIDERFSAVHTLTDGTRVRVRVLRPSDRELLRAGFEHLSPESRYLRFLAATPRLTERMLTYLTETDGWNHLAVGAQRIEADGSPGEGLGVARFVRLEDAPDVAEAAVTVVDHVQGHGLGTILLATLVQAARERGIRKFRAYVLPSNAPVQELLAELGPKVEPHASDGMLMCDVPLPPAEPEAIAKSLLYRVFRATATGLVELILRVARLGTGDAHDGGS